MRKSSSKTAPALSRQVGILETPAKSGGARIQELIAAHRPGWSLAQPFYNDPEIFDWDLERIFMRQWLFVGHMDRLRKAHDYFLFAIGKESIIITRDKQGGVHALFNTCRHRGSRVCLESQGSAKSLVCPYHGWAYASDGKLLSAVAMPDGFKKEDFGLKRCHVRVVEGMIFICMADEPPPRQKAWSDWERYLKPHGIKNAKIAASVTWDVKANWKLVVENFGECYHCGPAHPEYCAVMAHAIPASYQSPIRIKQFAELTEKWTKRAAALGNVTGRTAETPDKSYTCMRLPIKEGFLTQSRDGQPIAPLMGSFKEYDGGYTGCDLWPANYILASCDHAVIPRFTPIDALRTEVEMIWLVREDAVEGKDYNAEELTWIWRVTTDQDKKIVDDNQAGVNSKAYSPGPYAKPEKGLNAFILEYLKQLGQS